ncbi:hypothetical protein A2U01_0044581 [Trifolium medium]|uniref:Uncharacterized protein n=1 Tax=Trifolium medium TaxID=97028 RepID=A0A392QHR9_9FABA|nr:hypothetical protein [Trifolium medium]
MSATLGQENGSPNENTEKNADEKDLQERSTKKMKEGDQNFTNHSSLPKDYSDVIRMQETEHNRRSYRDQVTGQHHESMVEYVDDEEEEEDGV